jgi:hypothetical protein
MALYYKNSRQMPPPPRRADSLPTTHSTRLVVNAFK